MERKKELMDFKNVLIDVIKDYIVTTKKGTIKQKNITICSFFCV